MAPHVHSESTQTPEGPRSFPSFQHDPLSRRSLTGTSTTLSAGVPSPSSPVISHVALAEGLPHFGVGPLVMQPSASRSEETENSASSDQLDSSPRLAYLAILVIPIIGGIAIYLLVRRRKRQRPARHSAAPSLVLRSEVARARADSETPRMQQLPRDRIRAMNSVSRDNNETPSSPPAEYQIFSPRPPSPLDDDYPRPLGNYLSSVPGQVSSEPSTPLTISATSTASFTSCPPTPCTPGFAIPTISSPTSEEAPGEDEDSNEISRFTWDFRCKGVMNRLSGVTIESIMENSEVLGISIAEGNDVDTSSVILRCVTRTERCPSPEDTPTSTTAEADTSVRSDDSAISKSLAPVDPSKFLLEAGTSKSLTSSVSCYSTTSGLTVLDIKFDVTSFSSEVIAALSGTPSNLSVQACDANPASSSKAEEEQTPTKESKKRPVLSTPNHRNLAPKSPTLKINSQAFDSVSSRPESPASSLCAPKVISESAVPPQIIQPVYRAMRRERALSESNIRRSSSSCSLSATHFVNKTSLELCQAVSRRNALAKLGGISMMEGVLLHPSFSMPLALERLCLSHLANREN